MVKICVISTPSVKNTGPVTPVLPYKGGKFDYDEDLCNRTQFLPKDYVFSVRVYAKQYLHVRRACLQGSCNCVYFLDYIPTVLKPCQFAVAMYKYEMWSNKDVFVLQGVCRGFHVVDDDCSLRYKMHNYKSILAGDMQKQMCHTIDTELKSGQISCTSQPARCVHAMGAVQRPDGRLRPITDCSRPICSINDYMTTTAPTFKFSGIDDTRSLVQQKGYGCVVDISNAYRAVPIFPPHREFLGFTWETSGVECYYQDNVLCFGLRSAPAIFNELSTFVTRYMSCAGFEVVGYLDDYFYASSTHSKCAIGQDSIISFLETLGFKVNYKKVIPPSHSPRFLGIILDLENMMFKLPEDKLCKTASAVDAILEKSQVSHKKLERLAGLLAHCSLLIKGGRTFCRRLYSLLKATKGKRRVLLSEVVQQDLKWWKAFLRVFNGKCKITQDDIPSEEIYTDASGSGFGAWTEESFLFGFWGDDILSCSHLYQSPTFTDLTASNINVKELWPVVAALKRWGTAWSNKVILVHTDNMQVVAMLNTGRSKNVQAMELLREIFWCCSLGNISLKVSYINTKDNVMADRLSRIRLPLNVANVYGLPTEFGFCCINSAVG